MNARTHLPPAAVAVVGAGRMGAGIAHAFLVSGSSVVLFDVDGSALGRGRSKIVASLNRARSRGTLTGTPEEFVARLDTTSRLDSMGSVDLVIEAVPELVELKSTVWREITEAVPQTTILATNTSSISVTELAASVTVPERFLGMHFFNPVPVSLLVELVTSPSTTTETVALARQWVAAIGKEPIVVSDAPGFASSRLGLAIGLEAIRMLEEEVASAEDIDRAMVLGYGFPVGPLRLTDLVGLDVRLEIAHYLEARLGPRFRPPELLRHKVSSGELGRKSGRGFYRWSDDTSDHA